jgi:prepilin-type N-terminal cleavage/methylation domain-containing protein
MKLFKNMRNRPRWKSARGFTLAEMMITVVVFLFIFAGTWIAVQVFGLRIYTLAATKLVATAGGRQALNQIRDQIREGKMVYVGTCSSVNGSSFQLITNTQPQQGNALIIYPTTNTANYSVFYLDTSTTTNRLVQFNVASNSIITFTNTLTKYITNQIVFDARDWQNNIVTNYQSLDNRLLIEVTMQFSQWEYPIAFVGGVGLNAFDYYQLRTRVFRRAWN